MKSRRRISMCVAAVAAAALLAGCGSSGSSSAPTEPAGSGDAPSPSGAAALLPSDIRDRGTLIVATDGTFPPFASFAADGTTLQGIDVDLGAALSPILGVKVDVQNAKFDGFIPGLQSKRYDALFSALVDTPDRREVADFIDFINNGQTVLVKKGSGIDITSLDSLCGLKVATQSGDQAVPIVEEQKTKCESEGKPALVIQQYQGGNDALLALQSGRADAQFGAIITLGYMANQSDGALELSGPLLGAAKTGGAAALKGSPVAQALLAAFTEIYQSGKLKEIFDKYGLGNAVREPAMNAA